MFNKVFKGASLILCLFVMAWIGGAILEYATPAEAQVSYGYRGNANGDWNFEPGPATFVKAKARTTRLIGSNASDTTLAYYCFGADVIALEVDVSRHDTANDENVSVSLIPMVGDKEVSDVHLSTITSPTTNNVLVVAATAVSPVTAVITAVNVYNKFRIRVFHDNSAALDTTDVKVRPYLLFKSR